MNHPAHGQSCPVDARYGGRADNMPRPWMLPLAVILLLPSCIAPHASAGRDADASISAVRAEIDRLDAALLSIRTDLRAGRDVNQNDKWTLRLLGLAVLLLGLSYPVGKLIWIRLSGLRGDSRTSGRDSELMTPFSAGSPRRDVSSIDAFGQHRPATTRKT